ncbi:MAG: hypothetical protein CMJ94_01430 [Planctomycetes bacterium]|nr:hypothetical protein [Planctomycetota bacterium]
MLLSALTLLMLQQAAPPELELHRVPGNAQFAGVYHPATGLDRSGQQARQGPELLWNSLNQSNYYSYGGAYQEWIDEGTLPQRHAELNEQINGLRFTYCSLNPHPNGVSDVLRIYEENDSCPGPPAWPTSTCAYTLQGLPGGTPNGEVQCWVVYVNLSGFECNLEIDPAQGQMFGWSHTWRSEQTGAWVCWRVPHGSEDNFDWYDRTATNQNAAFLGCYWFGGQPPSQFVMGFYGSPPDVFAESARSGPGADDNLMLCAEDSFRVGQAPVVRVLGLDEPGLVKNSLLWASTQRVEMDLQPALGLDAHLLVPRWNQAWESHSPSGLHQGTALPAWASGRTYYLQAAQLGPAGRPLAFSAHALRVLVQ